MAGSDTLDAGFPGVAGEPVGYTGRPGFSHGGVGVAACWYGRRARRGAGTAVRRVQARRRPALAHLGAADIRLRAVRDALLQAADEIDADPPTWTAFRNRVADGVLQVRLPGAG